jgi:hypothetical protein
MRAWRAEGAGIRAIAERLNAEGVPTKRRGRRHATNVARLLDEEARATRSAGSPWPFWKTGDDPLLGRTPATSGDTYYLEGQLPPCSWCQVAMEEVAQETGTNWVYSWVDKNGLRQFWWRGPNS